MNSGKKDIDGNYIGEGDVITFNTQTGHYEGTVYYDSNTAAFWINTDSGNFMLGGSAVYDHKIIRKKRKYNPTV